jgi:xylulokinase
VILTLDLGTTVTKAAIWGEDGLVARARVQLTTAHPAPGRAEQDPASWWGSVVTACAALGESTPDATSRVEVLCLAAARETFVPVAPDGRPLGPGLLWSDRRAATESSALSRRLGGADAVRALTGVPLDAGAVAAKIAWLDAHDPEQLTAARWLLTPRDLVLWRLTGEVVTDPTLASRSGLYAVDGELVEELAGPASGLLPPVVPSDAVIGALRPGPAAELGLPVGIPVVPGAGDRACEVLGTGASPHQPMVSWGTTANVSVPVDVPPDPMPPELARSRGAIDGWVLEGGLSAAGSFLDWLGRLLGQDPSALAGLAASSPPGARGVVAVPWLDGARAPWWRDGARAAFVGLGAAHDAGDLARAVLESVAWEVARCLRVLEAADPRCRPAVLVLGGGGAADVWVSVLTAVTNLSARRRRSADGASAGAALLAARALGRQVDLDRLDPPGARLLPDPAAAERYAALRPGAEETAAALLGLA